MSWASPGHAKRREGAREGLGGGHDVSSGMPGTQLCAWLPGEDDRREEVGWAGWASPWAPGKLFSFFFCLIFPFFNSFSVICWLANKIPSHFIKC